MLLLDAEGWLARPAAEGEDTGNPGGRSEPLTSLEHLNAHRQGAGEASAAPRGLHP